MKSRMFRSHLRAIALALAGFVAVPPAGAQGPIAMPAQAEPAAEVVLATGRVTVTSLSAGTRALGAGDTVAAGDRIITDRNSYVNLRFRDGGRILLRPETEFTVDAYAYAPPAAPDAAPASGASRAFFGLVRGGFRAISGLIGKASKQDYKVTTPVATLGIRGTDYEAILCENDCPTPQMSGRRDDDALLFASNDTGTRVDVAQGGAAPPEARIGLLVAVNNGGVLVNTPRGTFQVDVGQYLLTLPTGQAFILPVPPDSMLLNPAPDPAACD